MLLYIHYIKQLFFEILLNSIDKGRNSRETLLNVWRFFLKDLYKYNFCSFKKSRFGSRITESATRMYINVMNTSKPPGIFHRTLASSMAGIRLIVFCAIRRTRPAVRFSRRKMKQPKREFHLSKKEQWAVMPGLFFYHGSHFLNSPPHTTSRAFLSATNKLFYNSSSQQQIFSTSTHPIKIQTTGTK